MNSNGKISAHELKHLIDTKAPEDDRVFYSNYLFDSRWKATIHADPKGEINKEELYRIVEELGNAANDRDQKKRAAANSTAGGNATVATTL